MKGKTLYFIPLIIGIFLIVFVLMNPKANANPPTFLQINATATATTSVVYMTPGTATTTLTCDAYQYLGTGSVDGQLTQWLTIQFTASNTAAVLDHTVSYSYDGVDYFDQSAASSFAAGQYQLASSSPVQRWNPATTIASTTRKLIAYDAPARYLRFTFVQPIGSTNGALWAACTGVKERF